MLMRGTGCCVGESECGVGDGRGPLPGGTCSFQFQSGSGTIYNFDGGTLVGEPSTLALLLPGLWVLGIHRLKRSLPYSFRHSPQKPRDVDNPRFPPIILVDLLRNVLRPVSLRR